MCVCVCLSSFHSQSSPGRQILYFNDVETGAQSLTQLTQGHRAEKWPGATSQEAWLARHGLLTAREGRKPEAVAQARSVPQALLLRGLQIPGRQGKGEAGGGVPRDPDAWALECGLLRGASAWSPGTSGEPRPPALLVTAGDAILEAEAKDKMCLPVYVSRISFFMVNFSQNIKGGEKAIENEWY